MLVLYLFQSPDDKKKGKPVTYWKNGKGSVKMKRNTVKRTGNCYNKKLTLANI